MFSKPFVQIQFWEVGFSVTQRHSKCPSALKVNVAPLVSNLLSLVSTLQSLNQVALTYIHTDGSSANGDYPANPNGSVLDIAGICNPQGNVLGLMPHPENHIFDHQHPRHTRGEKGNSGLSLFENGVKYASDL